MKLKFVRERWFQIFIGGILLFSVTDQGFRITGNPNFLPTLILLGAFIVPATFIAYFYGHVRDRDISMPLLTTCFIIGGVLGIVSAGVLEFATLQNLGVLTLFGVGLIEEGVKLIFPIAMYLSWRVRHEADGLLFGIAAGMGFAALETMGYGLVSLIQSGGYVDAVAQLLLIRGLLSPAGHAAWTGFICAVLWRQRLKTGHIFNLSVFGAFLLAVVLHTLWNILASLSPQTASGFIIVTVGMLIIAAISLTLVVRRLRESRSPLQHAS
jgi:RsiW-degrading membrane proteinase PrsW (M82 family)